MSSLQLCHVPSHCTQTAPRSRRFIYSSSRWTWIEVQRFSLPVSVSTSILNIIISVLASLVIWSSTRVTAPTKTRFHTNIVKIMSLLFILLPVILATLSLSDGGRPAVRSCLTEARWEHLYQTKNERVVKEIQTQLLCCGYNSIRDRAWPFPARGVDATACERSLGFMTPCGPFLKEKMLVTNVISGFGSVLNFLLLVSLGKHVFMWKQC